MCAGGSTEQAVSLRLEGFGNLNWVEGFHVYRGMNLQTVSLPTMRASHKSWWATDGMLRFSCCK